MIDQDIGAGRYRVGRVLARGGMAHVRLGLDVRAGHAVAVKYLNADAAQRERPTPVRGRGDHRGLEDPGVVRVLD